VLIGPAAAVSAPPRSSSPTVARPLSPPSAAPEGGEGRALGADHVINREEPGRGAQATRKEGVDVVFGTSGRTPLRNQSQ
jgi:hypothetical protein